VYGNILIETFWSIVMNLWRYEVDDDMVDIDFDDFIRTCALLL